MPLSHGDGSRVFAGGRFAGRWRYDRTTGRGIALSYDRPQVARGGFGGRWRYDRVAGPGIRLSYDRSPSVAPAPPPPPALPEPRPAATPASTVRVLCSCGQEFTFEGDAANCPTCGRLAEWPTMGQVEREMRSELEELLRAHTEGS